MKHLEGSKFIKAENRRAAARGWEEREVGSYCSWDGVSGGEDEGLERRQC